MFKAEENAQRELSEFATEFQEIEAIARAVEMQGPGL